MNWARGRGRWLLVGLLLGLAAGLVLAFGLPDRSQSRSEQQQQALAGQLAGIKAGTAAPDFTLESYQGAQVQLADFRGQTVVLNFWATWCGPCRLEMPTLQSRYEQYQSEGLVVLGINAGESRQQIAGFREELGITFPLLLDPDEEIQRLYQIRAYPTTMIVNSEGDIAEVHFGVLTESQLDGYLADMGVGG